jgi:Domain of unknown function (DUF1707)/Cell wall-active antibiotics response 4TMS YvqF
MSELDLRASDADRDRAVARLRENLVEGRLTLEEFSGRVDAAHASRTLAELEALTRDLPAETAPAPQRKPTRWSVAVMGGVERKNRWRVPESTYAIAIMGGCELDLRRAEIESSVVEITAVAVMGGVDIIVPEGVPVEVSGFALMGAKDENVKDVPLLPGAPLIRVRAFALMGGVSVRSKPRSRGLGPPSMAPLPPPPPPRVL